MRDTFIIAVTETRTIAMPDVPGKRGKEKRKEIEVRKFINLFSATERISKIRGFSWIQMTFVHRRETVFRSMESNMEYYYNINRRLLSFIGQWPYQKPKEKWAFFILMLIILTNLIITQVTLTVI